MSKKNQELSEKEKVQQENNLLKAKLIAETGAFFPDAPSAENEGSQLGPEIENEWLNYIYNFEQLNKDAPTVTVYEKIGKPSFKPSHELDDISVSKELRSLLETMVKNSVDLSCICEYDDRVIYEFITEELFDYKLQDIKMEGFFTCFTYEEFHPNHDYDLRRQAEDFITALLSREWHKIDGTLISDRITDIKGNIISKENFIRNITMFKDSLPSFDVKKQEITQVWFDLEKGKAYVDMELSYDALSEGREKRNFSGKSKILFLLEYDYWCINQVFIPGFNK